MTEIHAVGVLYETKVEVLCIQEELELMFFCNGFEDPTLENRIRTMMKERHLISGTFIPDEESMLNVLNVLRFYFFDGNPSLVESKGNIGELPFEDGKIY